jgi:hypothetical protein
MANAMAHLLQQYLDENSHDLGSGFYKELSDKTMNLSKEMQELHRNVCLDTLVRIVSSVPSAMQSAPVLELLESKRMYEDFTHMLVDHKMQEIQKIPNIQLRSSMISAWKDDMVVALLDNHTIDKFKVSTDDQGHRSWLQQCVEKLLTMKTGMINRITKRLDEKGVTPSALFPINIVPGMGISVDNVKYHIPGVEKSLELEPLLAKWLLGLPKGEEWPDVHDLPVDGFSQDEQSLRKVLLQYAELCGGNDTLINDNQGLPEIKDDDFQDKFNALVFETTYRPFLQTYGYDSSLGHNLAPFDSKDLRKNVTRKRATSLSSSRREQTPIAKRSINRR